MITLDTICAIPESPGARLVAWFQRLDRFWAIAGATTISTRIRRCPRSLGRIRQFTLESLGWPSQPVWGLIPDENNRADWLGQRRDRA